jgi:plastocyanin
MVVVALTAALALSAVAFAATKKVGVKGLAFAVHGKVTHSLKIKRGTTVKWAWSGSVPHNVVGKGFKSKLTPKGSISHKFTKKGTYTVVCTIHKAAGMTMKIKVS